jgi:hypothetical protein
LLLAADIRRLKAQTEKLIKETASVCQYILDQLSGKIKMHLPAAGNTAQK